MGRQAPGSGGQPPGSNNLWRRFRTRPPAIQGLALLVTALVIFGAAKVATAGSQKPAPAVSAGPLATTAPNTPAAVGTTSTKAEGTTTTKVPVPVLSAPVAAKGELLTKWIYLEGSAGIPKTCAHPAYQIAVTNGLGQTLGLGTIQLGSPAVSHLSDGTTAVTCSESYTVTVAQAASYTFALMLQSDTTKVRSTQVVTLAALRTNGAPSLSSTEG
jgi:hypothetical protein